MSVLLVRADGGADIGAGHVMRCLGLAQAWRAAGGMVLFVSCVLDAPMAERVEREGFNITRIDGPRGSLQDAVATRALIQKHKATWLVLDGYCFDSQYQADVVGDGHHALMMDDTGEFGPYYTDIVVNQNLHAVPEMYADSTGVRLLLGPSFALMRDEFALRDVDRCTVQAVARSLLVTLGGSDLAGHTERVAEAVRQVADPGLRCVVVIGSGNSHAEAIELAAATDPRVTVRRSVEDMAELMASADMALASGGSTVWELARMGVPTLVGSTSPPEHLAAIGLVSRGLFRYLGAFENLRPVSLATAIESLASDARLRQTMSVQARQMVDGRGRERVLCAMKEVTSHAT